MYYPEEYTITIPSYFKRDGERMILIIDLKSLELFIQIPGRNLDGLTWLEEFRSLPQGSSAVDQLLDDKRKFRFSDLLLEKFTSGIYHSGSNETKYIDTVNWISRRLFREWDPKQALIECRKSFGIGRFTIDSLEAQYIRMVPKLKRFLLQNYSSIHSLKSSAECDQKSGYCKLVYERLMFMLMAQFDEPCSKLLEAQASLRKLFQVKVCPFKDHDIGFDLYNVTLSNSVPFAEIARKIISDVNHFPMTIPDDPVSFIYLFCFWKTNLLDDGGFAIIEPFPDSLVADVKFAEMLFHDAMDRAEKAAVYTEADAELLLGFVPEE